MDDTYTSIMRTVQAVCTERDLANWLFYQSSLQLSYNYYGSRPAWIVMLVEPQSDKRERPTEKIVGHSYGTAFEAIANARVNMV